MSISILSPRQAHGRALSDTSSPKTAVLEELLEEETYSRSATQQIALIHEALDNLPSFRCPEELQGNLEQLNLTDDSFQASRTPPLLLRPTMMPPLPDEHNTKAKLPVDVDMNVLDDVYDLLQSAQLAYDQCSYQQALMALYEAYEAWDRSQPDTVDSKLSDDSASADPPASSSSSSSPKAADAKAADDSAVRPRRRSALELQLEVYILSSIGSVLQTQQADERALLYHWRAKISLALLFDGDGSYSQTEAPMLNIRRLSKESLMLSSDAASHDRALLEPIPIAAVVYDNMGVCCYYMGEFELALKCFNASSTMRFKSVSPTSPEYADVGASLNNIAVCLFRLKQFMSAYCYLQGAQEMLADMLDIAHPRRRTVNANVVTVRPHHHDLPSSAYMETQRAIAEAKDKVGKGGSTKTPPTLPTAKPDPSVLPGDPAYVRPLRLFTFTWHPVTKYMLAKQGKGGKKKKKKGKGKKKR